MKDFPKYQRSNYCSLQMREQIKLAKERPNIATMCQIFTKSQKIIFKAFQCLE